MVAIEAYSHGLMKIKERVDAFLAPSRFMMSKLIGGGLHPEKVQQVPYFLPDEMLRDDGDENQGYLLFLGKIDPIKGVRTLVEACRLVPELRVILAGRSTEPMAREMSESLPGNASYVGMKHGEELRALLHGAQGVVVPSLSYENQPFTILESFGYGKPVIGSRLGGIAELIGDGNRGLLVQPGDAADLARAMLWMKTHSMEAVRMGQAGREFVLANHTPQQHYERLMQIYQRFAV